MPSFLTGDELGNIKSLRVSPGSPSELCLLNATKSSVVALSVSPFVASTSKSVAAAYADGSVVNFKLENDHLELLNQWRETRLKPDQRFVGLQATDKGVYSCTSNGALRLVPAGLDDKQPVLGSLPTRLWDWRLAADQNTFAYGGDEVELSVWNTEQTFVFRSEQARSEDSSKKRKRDALFPGEVWRARNIQNDGLGLRQPVCITSLTYLTTSSAYQHHLLTGTQFGDVRRYDTRARRPVSDWKGVGKIGGVKVIEKGLEEHEVFVSDHGSNLFSLDLRNGRVIYSYKGLSGAITSIAPSPSLLVSTALDRYSRVHTSFPPPPEAGQSQDKKGEVVEKVFMTSTPTVVVWDGLQSVPAAPEIEGEDDALWDEMESVLDDPDDDESSGKKRRRKVD